MNTPLIKLKCIIVDDEPLAQDVIASFIEKTPNLRLIQKCDNAEQAKEVLLREDIDLMFLDINMPQQSGIDFVKNLDKKPLFIFTTAYQEYAVEGFELDALDYLLKPISYERFEKAILKASEYFSLRNDKDFAESSIENEFIFVKANQKLVKVAYGDIYYVEAFADYVKIFLENGKIVTLQTMKNMEKSLPEVLFTRVHRSFIVNTTKVSSFSGVSCEVNGISIPIGKSYKDEFLEKMKSLS